MKLSSCRIICVVTSLLAVSFLSYAAQLFEAPATFKASKILSKELLSGPNHQVDENVANDGFLNTYTIKSKFGDVQATSTATLRKYIHEINAVARMKEIQGSDEFAKGMTEKAGAVVEGAEALITDPVGTVSSSVSGVGKLFSRANESLTGGSRSDAEGSRMASLLGYEKAKRDIGYEFGVDVYSRNKILQDELNSLSGANGTGTLVMSGLLMAVPGGAGVAVSVTGGTEMMSDVMRDNAPADLRKLNRKKLLGMGVSQDVADIFIANGIYTPQEQTLLVGALDSMKNTANRSEYIKFATLTDDPDIAFFRQRQAQMYAAYNKSVQPIDSFISVGSVSTAKTKDGKIVFNVPLDDLVWTKNMAALASVITNKVSLMEGVTGRELWNTGSVSAVAKESLEKMGWTVHEHAEKKLALQ